MKSEELIAKYPELFKQVHLPENQTCMCWGICCDKGWYPIIDKLCAALMGCAEDEETDPPSFSQIKEKFGLLRIYLDGATERMWKQVAHAEWASGCVCEQCGSTEDVTTRSRGGWILTLCKKCSEAK